MMTDTELLDGLQRLFVDHVVAMRSCRSGVKIEVAEGEFSWVEDPRSLAIVRHYYGSDGSGNDPFGPDVRAAIERAVQGERDLLVAIERTLARKDA